MTKLSTANKKINESVARKIARAYGEEAGTNGGPKVYTYAHVTGYGHGYSIVWEGPEDWVTEITQYPEDVPLSGSRAKLIEIPAGWYFEPINHWSIALYRA